VVKYFKYISSCLLITILAYPQDSKISEKEIELGLIKNEIEVLENELFEKSSEEKKSFEAVENLSKQGHLLNKAISSSQNVINEKEKEINRLENKIGIIKGDIKTLKNNYASYVVAVYKKGPYNELEALVDASSLQQAVLRMHYLQEFSEKREKDLEKLKVKKSELSVTKKNLEAEKKREI
jgi:septal ring factor EnvC (AmiA/AmiB activator)